MATPDWLSELFAAISALAGLGATIAAFKTVRVFQEINVEGRIVRTVERNVGYYKLFVLDPAVPAIQAFTEAATSIVTKGIAELNAMPSTTSQADVVSRTDRVIQAFIRVRSGLHRHLFYATAAWPDDSLWTTISSLLRALEDEVVEDLAKLVAPAARNEAAITERIQRRAAGILSALAAYDLTTHPADPTKLPPSAH